MSVVGIFSRHAVTPKLRRLFLIQMKSRLMLHYGVFLHNDPHAAAVNFFLLTQLPGCLVAGVVGV